MLKNSPKRIGEIIELTVDFDPIKREVIPDPKLLRALSENKEAEMVFNNLRPSLQLEIVKYISSLKTEKSVDKNIEKAIRYLKGQGKFLGRLRP
ncbi:MAG: YdeI/OmpD-associated family protein [Saprospiraceae bacterium]